MTPTEILAALGQTVLVAGVVFVVLVLLASHLRYQALTRGTARAPGGGADQREDAFQLRIAHHLGTAHRNPPPFSVMLVSPERWHTLVDQYGAPRLAELLSQMEQRAVGLIRRRDAVMQFRDDAIGLVIRAGRDAANGIGRRVVAAMAKDPYRLESGLLLRVTPVIGAAAYPEDGDRAGALRAKAEAALQHARVEGTSPQWPPDTVAPAPAAAIGHTGVADEEQKPLLDEPTGVLQESRMEMALQKYVAQCRRDDVPVSILCLDVDYLRRYNDQYGRRTGDQLLRQVADFLKASTRESDLIARHSGDQFLLAVACKPAEGIAVAQRLWMGVRRMAFAAGGPGLRLTVTIGVAGFPDHGGVARLLYERAQLALRVAKSKGRNQCLVYSQDLEDSQGGRGGHDAF